MLDNKDELIKRFAQAIVDSSCVYTNDGGDDWVCPHCEARMSDTYSFNGADEIVHSDSCIYLQALGALADV